ncbi:class I SAM-dependent methyltransferase [Nonomuraea gerenzanensis]|uniref:Methyltransferase n=1 Tax=Nonomuraea gerenzanensis TaxID=93944 RepID=A0A1M4EBG1_9ACTN|nr:class I SAM-dependent methyltransferase [Nonomuraea gerenzanensis]UBU18307.1 class I SAM-dependent methyltransferase [Nonomuraea gerenzanensis]SBO96130.1 methyltransferase [Nonomuraea gerenzanensis]
MENETGTPERPVDVQRPDWIATATEPLDPATPVNDYDSFAEEYSAENESSLLNAYIERPAMVALAGDVAGRRILDAGCGSGALAAELRGRGAVVTGIDFSAGMLAVARRRLGDDADLRVADLREPLPFDDGTFDDVMASLVLHYLKDWGPTLAEMRRVLRPGGRLIASVNHPFVDWLAEDPRPVYRETTSCTDLWTFGGKSYPLVFWRRPLHAMTEAFTGAGFRLCAISEPKTAPDAPEPFSGISFMCFVVEVPPAG